MSEHRAQVAVLIPAAGEGKRLGGQRKQFRQLDGKPLLVQTLLIFEHHPKVDHILVATPTEVVEPLTRELFAIGISKLTAVVAGGDTRQDSVGAALQGVSEEVEIVLVHDAVRPFVRAAQVSAVIDAARKSGAAALAVPVADTLRQGRDGCFGETVPRTMLYRMQTPQGFQRTWFEAAHARATSLSIQATDDVELVQQLGHVVQVVPGSTQNVKITTPEDWALATCIWQHWKAMA